ncbi:CU044_2847 family protein [[Actinomadura] parvosata]|uniref:CU044_2847 family protein n=1 Tax=[Actinomadura] parvosata TaxID=1955412 RepID=UPI0009AD3224|nr:CU044_2847 family protein [Nonomuraea sp. ATCC 55076]
MDRLLSVSVETDKEAVIVFEVDRDLMGEDLDLAAGDGTVARARKSLDRALQGIKPALVQVIDTLRETSPDEVEIEFGLKVGGESTVVIAKGTSEVNFAIRALWKRT